MPPAPPAPPPTRSGSTWPRSPTPSSSGPTPSTATSRPLLVLTSGAHRVDTAKLADLVGLEEISTADADFVRTRTGYAIGGVPPLAHLEPPLTVVDVSLSRYETIWAAAGHPHTVFPTSYDELLRLTGGTPAEVA